MSKYQQPQKKYYTKSNFQLAYTANMIPKKDYLALWSIVFFCSKLSSINGLQGISTWMCLGIKSPFIEFKSEFEILSNSSISLNLTQDSSKIPFQKGVQTLDTFINSIDINNKSSSTESNSQLPIFNSPNDDESTTRAAVYSITTLKSTQSQKAFTNDINEKQVTIIEEQHSGDNPLFADDRRERKYIIPLALKTTSNEKEKTSSIFQGSSTNIDDLKKHILMLQNLTINDKSFQSKFVVFPSLQKKDEMTLNTSTQPTELYNRFFSAPTRTTTMSRTTSPRPSFTTQYSVPRTQPTIIKPLDGMFSKPEDILRDTSKEYYRTEKITIIPQVLLQNDQTPVSVDDDTNVKSNNNNKKKGGKINHSKDSVKRRNLRKNTKRMTTTMKPTTAKRTTRISRNNGGVVSRSYATTTTTTINNDCKEISLNGHCKSATLQKRAREKRNVKYSSRRATNNTAFAATGEKGQTVKNQRLNRDIFFPINNTSGMSKDSLIPDSSWKYLNQTNLNFNENIDLNPENCYKVSGFSEGQKKLCLLHTEIMPSISRGARSAIQECKHQFKPRRWDCSTVDDDTVFGPITGIGSPEMAYVYALASAGVTSFVARACRDGQLAQCGCSRSSRPKQLHEDWTWGGCGDDLEFGYKFSQMFIDIKEKEKKRGIRGLVSIPQKYPKLQEKLLAGETTSNDTLVDINEKKTNKNATEKAFKTEELLKLQEKISKKILSINLEDIPMSELQEKINKEIMDSNLFNSESKRQPYDDRKTSQISGSSLNRVKNSAFAKARSLMNLHNNEAGRRAVIKKARITCKCHGVSGSCSLITCWQQLTSMREIGDFLKEKYDAATQVKLNRRGRLQVKDPRYKLPTALDLVYLEESPDWCRSDKQMQWAGTHGRVCNKTSTGLDGCPILCCGRGYNTKKKVARDRCNCKFQWCCHVKCDTCVKVIEEYTCK